MRRIIILMLTILTVAGVFTACGGNDATETATVETTAVEATTQAEDVTQAEDTTQGETNVDSVTSASVTDDVNVLVNALGSEGTWIAAALNDMDYEGEIIVEGAFENKGKTDRKLALYTQDEDYNITGSYTLTAPKMSVRSPHFRINGGVFKGDVYVEADEFQLTKQATIEGNLTFKTKSALNTFLIDDTSTVVGTISCEEVDVVTSPSLVIDANALASGLSKEGTWIVATYNNITLTRDLVVEGEFKYEGEVTRMLGLYDQDKNGIMTASYSLTLPKIIVKSENFTIKGGTLKGDVLVEANGFKLDKETTIEGNIVFAKQEYKDSFVMDESAQIKGELSVK